MKYPFFLLYVLITLFTLSSCKDSGTATSGSTTIQDIFPMKVGDSWKYHVQRFKNDGSISEDTIEDHLLRSQQTFQGHTAFETSTDGDISGNSELFIFGDDLYQVGSAKSATPYINHILHYPANIGEVVVLKDTTYPDGHINHVGMILKSNNETVTTSDGKTYSCFHFYEYQLSGLAATADTNVVIELYLASGIGEVIEKDYEFFHGHGIRDLKQSYELISYQLK